MKLLSGHARLAGVFGFRVLPFLAECAGAQFAVVGTGSEVGGFDAFEQRDAEFVAGLGDGFGGLAGFGHGADIILEEDFRSAVFGLGEGFLDPWLVEAGRIVGESAGFDENLVFLDLFAVVVEDRLAIFLFVAEVTFDDRVVLEAHALMVELHIVLNALEDHEDRGARDGDAHEDLEATPVAEFERCPGKDHRDR